MKYTWKVPALDICQDVDGLTDVVIAAYWSCTLSDGGNQEVSTVGSVVFPRPSQKGFTPYDALDEALVVTWVKSMIEASAIESSLARQMHELMNPSVIRGATPPWISNG